MKPIVNRVVCVVGLLLAAAPAASAQDTSSHWGVSGSIIPRWSFPTMLADLINIETDMQGVEFRAGVVRGSDAGGDWGVSFVKKIVDQNSVVQHRESACVDMSGAVQCARGAYDVTRRARMTGVEAYLFMPFAEIKRVQIGGTFALGVARLEGTSDRYLEHLVVNGSTVTTGTMPLGEVPFRDTLRDWRDLSPFPIGRAELGVGVLLAPGFKLRASTGVSWPGVHTLSVHAHYLFGAGSGVGPRAQTP